MSLKRKAAEATTQVLEEPSISLNDVLCATDRRPVDVQASPWKAQPQWATLYVQYITTLVQQAAQQMRRDMEGERLDRLRYEMDRLRYEQERRGGPRRRGGCQICGDPNCNDPSRYDDSGFNPYFEDRSNGQ